MVNEIQEISRRYQVEGTYLDGPNLRTEEAPYGKVVIRPNSRLSVVGKHRGKMPEFPGFTNVFGILVGNIEYFEDGKNKLEPVRKYRFVVDSLLVTQIEDIKEQLRKSGYEEPFNILNEPGKWKGGH